LEATTMALETVELPTEVIEYAKAMTGKRTARAAITDLVQKAGNVPNAATARILREPAGRGRTFDNAKDAVAHIRKILGA
jgi:hypothetical protein